MNQITGQFTNPVPRVIAMTTLVAALAFVGPASARGDDLASASGVDTVPTRFADATPAPAPAAKKKASGPADKDSDDDSGEARIKHLHDKLQITPAQEDMWNKVAAVMRDNAEKLTALAKDRAEKAKTMTAIDDLNSYAEIAEAHEDGTKKLIPVFKALYDSMSDVQKKAADTEFREHAHHEHPRHSRAAQ